MANKTKIVFGGSRKDDHYKKFIKYGIGTLILAVVTVGCMSDRDTEWLALLCFITGSIAAIVSFYNFIMYRYTKKNS